MNLLDDLLALALADGAPSAGAERVAVITARLRETEQLDLEALEHATIELFESLYAAGEYNPDDVPRLEALADVTDATRELIAEQNAARVQRDQRVSSLADRVRAPQSAVNLGEDDGAGNGDGTGGTDQQPAPADPQVGDPDAPESPTTPSRTDGGGDGPGEAEPSSPPATEPAQARTAPPLNPTSTAPPVAAAAAPAPVAAPPVPRTTSARLAAARTPVHAAAPAPPQQPLRRLAITASAEVPNIPYGKTLTLRELAQAALSRWATLPVGQPQTVKANVGLIHRNHHPSIQLTGNNSDYDLIDRVADEKRLPGGSLVAAATKALTAAAVAPSIVNDVWCTPSETDYTLCPALATTTGMLDLPTTGMPMRGGVRYPVWTQYPDQAADSANNGWHGTVIQYPANPNTSGGGTGLDNPDYWHPSADGGLGNTKACITGPCVEWREARQNLAYLCITSDVLRDRTFPEGVERFVSDVLVHHQHYLNSIYLAYIQAASDPIPAFSVQNGAGQIGSTSLTVLDRLALLVTWFRGRYQMADDATLEIVCPDWLEEFLKRDIEKKNNRPFGAVTDAEIASLFAEYATRVQWVRDWQPLGDGTAVNGRIMPPAGWPTSVQIMAYPAGSWVLSEANVLTFGVQYDYQLLQQNKYSQSFTEDSWLLLNRCNRTFTVQLTDLCANGAVGPFRDACATAAPGSSATSPLYMETVTGAAANPEADADADADATAEPADADKAGADTKATHGKGSSTKK